MRRFLFLITVLFSAVAAFAQTPAEIISRMEKVMNEHDSEGIAMTIDVKVPILGTMSTRSYGLGEKARVEAKAMGVELITWSDGETEWTYDAKKNEVTIENAKIERSASEGDAEMFTGLTEGYDVTIKRETADAWHLLCKKSKDNPNKDDPDKLDLVVAKGTYYPVSLTTRVSGMALTMRDISFGVSEKQVTFDWNDYPGVTVVDKR